MKFLVKLGISRMTILQKIDTSRHFTLSMTGNVNFPSPIPTLTVVATTTNQLEAAVLKAKGGSKSDTTAKRDKEEDLDLLLIQLAAYVQGVANQNEGTAEAVIQSAGMDVRSKSTRTIRDFEVFLTRVSGEVRLQYKAVKRGAYEFQICTDLTNEANWTTFEAGTRGRVVKSGLALNMRYYFRARVITPAGRSEWSEVRSVYVAA